MSSEPQKRYPWLHPTLKLAIWLAVGWYLLIQRHPFDATGDTTSTQAAITIGIFAFISLLLLRSKQLTMTLKLAICVGLVLWLFGRSDFDWQKLTRIRDGWPWFVAAQGVFFVCFLVTIVRWQLLLRALGVNCHFPEAARLGMIGLFFNQFAPGGSGGDVVKAYYLARANPDLKTESVFSVVLDRVMGLTGLMLLAGIALVLNFSIIASDRVLGAIAIGLTMIVLGIVLVGALVAWESFWHRPWVRALHRRLPGRDIIARLARSIWTVRGKRKLLFVTLAMSAVNHAGFIGMYILLARSIFTPAEILSAREFFLIVPVALLVNALPLSPGGIGTGEYAFDELFKRRGSAAGLAVALLMRITFLLWGLVGLCFYMAGRREIREVLEAARRDIAEHADDGTAEGPTSTLAAPDEGASDRPGNRVAISRLEQADPAG